MDCQTLVKLKAEFLEYITSLDSEEDKIIAYKLCVLGIICIGPIFR
jgi:hypothetical protein